MPEPITTVAGDLLTGDGSGLALPPLSNSVRRWETPGLPASSPGSIDLFAARFDGAAAWENLGDAQRAAIGAHALELLVCWNAVEAYEALGGRARPYERAEEVILESLHTWVADALPEVLEQEPLPVPSMLGQVCRRCGCSELDACYPPCGWAESDLCTRCAEGGDVA